MKKRDLLIVLMVLGIALIGIGVNKLMVQNNSSTSYVVISVNSEEYKRVSLDEPQTVVIDQGHKHNEVKITNNGVVMAASNCENQDCVKQGEATLDNIDNRVLGGWIVCLPNEVSIELVKGEAE